MDSYDESFPRLHGAAYRLAYRLLGDREQAMGVARESMARAYARWSAVHDYAEPWVCTAAADLAVDVARKGHSTLVDGDVADDRHQEERLDLQRALARLPRRQRQVVMLRYFAELPEEAVATALGCSVGSVQKQGSRAVSSLRTALTYSAVWS